jgi:thiamine-monophosphate kinase
MKRKLLSEDSILRRILASCRPSPSSSGVSQSIALGIGDDAAVFRPKARHEVILTCDWFLEGTHFLRDKHPADSVGWKCLARAISDIAAMGGTPRCFLLSLAIPASLTGRWLDAFLSGLRRASLKFGCPLAGGDTTQRHEVLINVTVIGEVKAGHAVPRSGARTGDILYVSGRLGGAEMGLKILKSAKRAASRMNPLTRKHLYPEPRLELGRWLAEKRIASAMIDLSDGLSSDLSRLCAASGVGARLDRDQFPAVRIPHFLLRRLGEALQMALHGGDDYELLFTAPSGSLPSLPWKFKNLRIYPIGVITSEPIVVYDEQGKSLILRPHGWDPFRKNK